MRAKALTASVLALIALAATADTASAQSRKKARPQTMEQCVSGVLGRLAKARAPEAQVGPTVVSQCDQPLRERLAAEIAAGRAAGCTVETCIDRARSRASEEAVMAYRNLGRR